MFRILLTWIFILNSVAGYALTPGQRAVIGGGVTPLVQWNFLQTPTLPAYLAVSRTNANATLFDSTGKLTYAPNNLYINSGAGTNTARTITTVAGVNYYIWVQTSTGAATVVASGTNTTTFNGSTGGTFTAFTATSGTLTLTPTTNFANITQVIVAQITYESALRSGDNVVTGATAYFGPRFEYDPVTLASSGLDLEAAATNLIINSAFAGNWTKQTAGDTFTANSGVSPAGTTTAAIFTPNTGAGAAHLVFNTTGLTLTAANYTWSAYAKANGYNFGQITGKVGSVAARYAAVFNLTSGAITKTSTQGSLSGNAALVPVCISATTCRIAITLTATADATASFMGLAPVSTGTPTQDASLNPTYTGDGTSGAYFWGAQLELGSTASTYIPTNAANATRGDETLTISAPYSSDAMIVERTNIGTGITDRVYFAPGAATFATGYRYRSGAFYSRALTSSEQASKLSVGALY